MSRASLRQACQGAGLGLRPAHLRDVLRERPAIPWFEVHICNFLGGGLNRALLHQINKHYPLSFHGVNLNLGGTDALDWDYIHQLKRAYDEFSPDLVSEHACFTAHQGQHFHDLMPIPYTEDAVNHMADRIRQVQDRLGQQILIENVSRYFVYPESELSEAEFLAAVCEQADCGLLLDLNNAYVNQFNLYEDIDTLLATLPLDRVGEIHLAGHSVQDGRLIDTHATAVSDVVWQLYAKFCLINANIPCLIEWDNDLPSFQVLAGEQAKAQALINQAQSQQQAIRCNQ